MHCVYCCRVDVLVIGLLTELGKSVVQVAIRLCQLNML